MTQRYYNPFAGIDLIVPIEQDSDYDLYCQTGSRASIDQSPFPRKVDLWFVGLSLAVRKQLTPVDLSKRKTSKFNDGSILGRDDSDSWRVQAIMLVAIAIVGNVEIVGESRRMIAIANGLAAAGVPHIVEMIRDGDLDPIWNLSDAFDEILRNQKAV